MPCGFEVQTEKQRGSDRHHRPRCGSSGRIKVSMNSRLTTRRLLSLMLVLATGLWAETGLAIFPTDADIMQCHSRAMHAGQQAVSDEEQAFSSPPGPTEYADSMPCCPEQPEPLAPECGDKPCCAVSDMPVRPLAFLVVPGTSPSKQLSAAGHRTGILPVSHPPGVIAARAGDARLYVQPITEKKTDLRI
jgi:hypothetical protein